MKAKCCLIAVGGTGHRLKNDGINFPYSKSSLSVLGKPMIYWLLKSLEDAGIEKVIMTSERKDSLHYTKNIVEENFIGSFKETIFNMDLDLGSTGLPYQARELLDFPCFFEAGHSFQTPFHYKDMDKEYEDGCLIISGFPPKGYAPRYTVSVCNGAAEYSGKKLSKFGEIEIGSPKLFGKDFVEVLPQLGYDLNNIIPHYIENKKLKIIPGDMPLEADVNREWEEALPIYENFIKRNYFKEKLSLTAKL